MPTQDEQGSALAPTVKQPSKYRGYKLSQAQAQKALDLRLKGLSYQEIADYLVKDGVTISSHALSQRLSPLMPDDLDVSLYAKNRSDILAGVQLKLLSHLTDARLKDASAYQLAGMYGIFYDKERLERGQSTANVAHLTALVSRISERSYATTSIVDSQSIDDVQDVVLEPDNGGDEVSNNPQVLDNKGNMHAT
jgi:hypothetical protein